MRKKIAVLFILSLFFITSLSLLVKAQDKESKKVLIINSYNPGFEWTDEETSGIISSLSSHDEYIISTEYLDWKRYPTEENLNNAYSTIKFKYSQQKIDVIICTDDSAFSFSLKNRSELFPDVPIVFCGVNSKGLSEISEDQINFTGVLEQIDPESNIRTALSINPSIKNIYLIYDNTESGRTTGELCISAAKTVDSNLNVESLNYLSTKEIVEFISKIDKNSMILQTSYFPDVDGKNVNYQRFCENLNNVSPVPIFNLYDFSLGHGVFGGNLIIGELQGEEAGILAKRILNGEPASSIAITDRKTNKYIFDYNILKKYNLHKSDLPKDSELINKPFSFFETYRTLVYAVLLIFFLLVVFTIILLFYITKIKLMQLKLSENNDELTTLYADLTATEEELRAQLTEVSDAHEQLERYSIKLQEIAYHDTLTGLYNRLYLYEVIEKEISIKENLKAFFFIDLDNFKFVNDALGHNIGDELLIAISNKLSNLSTKNNCLIRLGGDEFVFYCNKIKSKTYAENFAKTIIKVFNKPFKIRNNYLTVTVSIGITLSPTNGMNVDTLLKNADIAMYKVKDSGKNGFFFYNSILKDELLTRINIENYFKKALNQNEFHLYYQPQININSCDIDGFEALIRWNSPELGMLSPVKFIAIAEETGFIVLLGEWILRTACLFIKQFNDRKNTNYKISVNISVIQLVQDNFVAIVKQILTESSLPPDLLELELTESVIMESPELVVEKIKELRSIGIRIALDDFGTGYSSLSYLRKIPITTLKIDKIFIDDISNQNSNTTVTDTIIDLGHKMNLTIVAEGVETEVQLDYLKKNNCDKIQGYLFSKPLPEADLDDFIENIKISINN